MYLKRNCLLGLCSLLLQDSSNSATELLIKDRVEKMYEQRYKQLALAAEEGSAYELSRANRNKDKANLNSLMSQTRGTVKKVTEEISNPKQDVQVGLEEDLMQRYNEAFGDTQEAFTNTQVASTDANKAFKVVLNSDTNNVGKRLMSDISETLGITDEQAAGIVGNLDHETGGFKYLQELNPTVPGSKGGRGFAMWTGPRRKSFEAWSAKNNLNPDSYEASFGFFIEEVQETSEGRFLKNLEKANSAEEAAKIFSQEYLRPGKPMMSSRISRANYYSGEK